MTTPELNHRGEHRQSVYGNTLELPSINIIDSDSNIRQREEARAPEWKPPRKPSGKLFALILVSILLVIGIVVGGAIGGRHLAEYGIVNS